MTEQGTGPTPAEMDELLELNITGEIAEKLKDDIGETVNKKFDEKISSERLRRLIRNNPKVQELLSEDMSPKQVMEVISNEISEIDMKQLTEEDISINANKIMNLIMSYIQRKDLNENTQIKMAERFLGKLADLKKSFYPATQRNLNVNVDVFKDRLNEWRQEREKMYLTVGADNNDKKNTQKKKK